MTPEQLKKIMPRCDAAIFTPLLNACFAEFGITSKADQAAFLGNVGAETAELTQLSENLNYSAQRLLEVFPTRFTPASAAALAGNPVAIGNTIYGGRYGNGPAEGYKYRGGGGIQLTFKANYEAGARRRGMPVEQFADWIRTPGGAIWSAGDFWKARNISAAVADFDKQCDLVNLGRKTEKVGDSLGYAKRLAIRNLALQVL